MVRLLLVMPSSNSNCASTSVTRRGDGSLRPNFKAMRQEAGFSVEQYALGVYNELCMALEGLIEEN